MTVAALYVQADGCYAGLPDVDPWPIERDARLYAGPHPVVAHPPCDRWHLLSAVNNARWGWTINEDGGCFAAALASVRAWGGVLEHPAESRAFKFYGIPEPIAGDWQLTIDGDWVVEVWQSGYGHPARKRTWLLYRGASPPPVLVWERRAGAYQVGFQDRRGKAKNKPPLSRIDAAATPPEFRDLLLAMARSASMARAA